MTSPSFDEQSFVSEVESVFTRLVQVGGLDANALRGVPEEELQAFERRLGFRLPNACRCFLLRWGAERAGVFDDYGVRLRGLQFLLDNRDELDEILRDNDGAPFLAKHLVIDENQAYSILFLDLTAGEDPPVHHWREGRGGVESAVVLEDSFSAFILRVLEEKRRYLEWASAQAERR